MKVFLLRTVDLSCGQGLMIIAATDKNQAVEYICQHLPIHLHIGDWDIDNIEEAEYLQTNLSEPQIIDYCCYIE